MHAVEPPAAVPAPVIIVTPRHTVHWVIAALLAVIAVTLILRDGGPLGVNAAFGQTGMLGARGVFAFTGQLNDNRYGLWMLDIDAGTVWCYEYNPVSRKMRLAAARTFRYDRYLENHQQDSPTPDEVEKLLEQQRQAINAARNIQNGLNAAALNAATQPGANVPPAAGS